MKPLSILLIALLLIQAFVDAKSADIGGGNVESLIKKQINCGNECSRRCSKSSRKKVCLRACKSCCATCNCVPPGTHGNKAVCPCYANLTTHGNKPKCP